MEECIIITNNTPEVRSALCDFSGIELVSSQSSYIAWHWLNPHAEDLISAQGHAEYKGIVQLA